MSISSAGFGMTVPRFKKMAPRPGANQAHKPHASSTSANQLEFKGAFQLFDYSPILPEGKEKHRKFSDDKATYTAKPIPPGPFNPHEYASDAILELAVKGRTVRYGLTDDEAGHELTKLKDLRASQFNADNEAARQKVRAEFQAFKEEIIETAKKPRGYMYFLNQLTQKYDLWFKHGGDYRQEEDWSGPKLTRMSPTDVFRGFKDETELLPGS